MNQHVLDIGYIVGFFDADGCVSWNTVRDRVYPRLTFNNTSYLSIEKVRDIIEREIGFRFKIYTQVMRNAEWKDSHSIQINNREMVVAVAKLLLDNGVLIKRQSLEKALQMIKDNRQENNSPPRRFWTPEEDYTIRTSWNQMTDREIGEMLERTRGAVRLRRYTLGLVKDVIVHA